MLLTALILLPTWLLGTILVVIAVVLAVAGVALYVWAARTLASAVPRALAAPAELLKRGPYRYVRNPLYLAAGAVFLGTAAAYAPWRAWDLGALAVVAILAHVFVVLREEPATRRRLGSAYDEYSADVPRWIPRSRHPRGTSTSARTSLLIALGTTCACSPVRQRTASPRVSSLEPVTSQ